MARIKLVLNERRLALLQAQQDAREQAADLVAADSDDVARLSAEETAAIEAVTQAGETSAPALDDVSEHEEREAQTQQQQAKEEVQQSVGAEKR